MIAIKCIGIADHFQQNGGKKKERKRKVEKVTKNAKKNSKAFQFKTRNMQNVTIMKRIVVYTFIEIHYTTVETCRSADANTCSLHYTGTKTDDVNNLFSIFFTLFVKRSRSLVNPRGGVF